jgi:hypothetical protein
MKPKYVIFISVAFLFSCDKERKYAENENYEKQKTGEIFIFDTVTSKDTNTNTIK